jgi:pimeloyl-ACP methyl ester carboxylesterase
MRVVLVHGYLAGPAIMWPLARRLAKMSHEVEHFSYPSTRGHLQDHAEALALLIAGKGDTAVVAHSLGGLVVHRALALEPRLPVTHRIFIATPHRGSRVVRLTTATPLAKVMGRSIRSAAGGEPVPLHTARTGVVIGSRDRTIRPEEADLSLAHDRLTLPFTHNELVWRPETAHAIHRFLTIGWFEEPIDRRSLGI